MAELSKSFPNIPVTHWLSLRTQFKQTIPTTISSNYLSSVLKMTEQSAKANIIPSLKQIGLIDQDGKTNQELAKKLRNDNLYPQLCKTILEDIYPQELRDAFADKDADKDQIKTWFMNHSGIGNSAASRIAAFYSALTDADLTLTKPVQKKSQEPRPKPTKGNISNKPTVSEIEDSSNKDTTPNNQSQAQKSKGPDLNINIQIHISSDASADQIKSIFENMAKYIYKV